MLFWLLRRRLKRSRQNQPEQAFGAGITRPDGR
jgi:hypothetical protein